jgi:drug/metabolite transporter (DMT)-like permease
LNHKTYLLPNNNRILLCATPQSEKFSTFRKGFCLTRIIDRQISPAKPAFAPQSCPSAKVLVHRETVSFRWRARGFRRFSDPRVVNLVQCPIEAGAGGGAVAFAQHPSPAAIGVGQSPYDLWIGAALIVAGELAFASVGAAIRVIAGEVSNEMVVFFRNAFALLLFVPWLIRDGLKYAASTESPSLHLVRGLAGLGAMYCFFYAIVHMPLAEAMLLKLSAPLFIPFVAYAWLRETAPWPARIAIGVGFAGVALILSPDLTTVAPVALVALLGGFLAAVAKVTVRRLSHTEPAGRIILYFTLIGTAVSAVPLLWAWATPTLHQAAWLFLIAVLATGGQWCLTRGLGHASAPRLAPFVYSSVIFGAAYGWWFWDEPVTLLTALGAALVALAGVLAANRRKEDVIATTG